MTPMDEVNLVAKIADLQEAHYHTALMLSAILDLLVAKGILTVNEVTAKAKQLEDADTPGA